MLSKLELSASQQENHDLEKHLGKGMLRSNAEQSTNWQRFSGKRVGYIHCLRTCCFYFHLWLKASHDTVIVCLEKILVAGAEMRRFISLVGSWRHYVWQPCAKLERWCMKRFKFHGTFGTELCDDKLSIEWKVNAVPFVVIWKDINTPQSIPLWATCMAWLFEPV